MTMTMTRRALGALGLGLALALPGAATAFARASSFPEIAAAADAKRLPSRIVRELAASGARVSIRATTGGPRYEPGLFGGGTIYLPFADSPAGEWRRGDWADFFNECFHAWWGNVFTRADAYATDRNELLRDSALQAKYRRAYPRDATLAQEEAYSETVASTISVAYPQIRLDPTTGDYVYVYPDYSTLYYRLNWTVAPVGHSDRPGYTPIAEETYPDEREFDRVMRWLFGRPAPARP